MTDDLIRLTEDPPARKTKTSEADERSVRPVEGPRRLSGECFGPTECLLGSTDDTFKPIGYH